MAFSVTSGNHESPAELSPAFSTKQLNTGTWGANSNTCVITDAKIHPNSVVLVQVTGTTPSLGNWSYTIAQGSVTITSTDAESSTLALSYIVL